MTEVQFHGWAVAVEFLLAGITLAALFFVAAPYGRYERGGWGPTVPSAVGWMIMEIPAVVLFATLFFTGAHRFDVVPLVLLGMWQLHYVNRTFVFPGRMREGARRMPVLIVCLGLTFNTLNAYVNARWIGQLGTYTVGWLADTRFLVGAAVFLAGWLGNLYSDETLRALRKPGEMGYAIPRGGLYRWISAPNYFCEIVEWFGWAIATWSTAGLAFAVYTTANLLPRALRHHAWYKAQFPEYPADRKALIPYLL